MSPLVMPQQIWIAGTGIRGLRLWNLGYHGDWIEKRACNVPLE